MSKPVFMEGRPMAHGLPVPYFVGSPATGAPDFRLLDGNRLRICLTYGKCGICAGLLRGQRQYLVVGPLALQNRIDGHAPVHEHCARYALASCPYLSIERRERRTDYPTGAVKLAGSVDEKPSEFYLVELDKWQWLVNGLVNFRPIRTLRYTYANGRLVESEDGWQKVAGSQPWRQEGARKL